MENLIERPSNEQLISKQELLKTMYISSNQLYRWKRLGLIPQEWFMKQITSTGQRTVFPRELIETRVYDILKYKEIYSLDDVVKILSNDMPKKLFTSKDISEINEIDKNIFKIFSKSIYTYIDILILIVLTDFCNKISPDNESFKNMAYSLLKANIDSKIYVITFIEYKGEYFTIITSDNTFFHTDIRYNKIAEYSLYDVSAKVFNKYRHLIKKDRSEMIEEAIDKMKSEIGG